MPYSIAGTEIPRAFVGSTRLVDIAVGSTRLNLPGLITSIVGPRSNVIYPPGNTVLRTIGLSWRPTIVRLNEVQWRITEIDNRRGTRTVGSWGTLGSNTASPVTRSIAFNNPRQWTYEFRYKENASDDWTDAGSLSFQSARG